MHVLYTTIGSLRLCNDSNETSYYGRMKRVMLSVHCESFPCYMFRGRIQIRMPIFKNGYEYLWIGIENEELQAVNLQREYNPILCKYFKRLCYDPRMFGRCTVSTSSWESHEMSDPDETVCGVCGQAFPGLIPPMIGGRIIHWLP